MRRYWITAISGEEGALTLALTFLTCGLAATMAFLDEKDPFIEAIRAKIQGVKRAKSLFH